MRATSTHSIGWLLALIILAKVFASLPLEVNSATQDGSIPAPPFTMTAEQDHKRIMDLLHITSLRPGADGRNTQASNAANYDEAKANPYPTLPDPLVLKNGKKVTTSKIWSNQRRAEIVEDFDREIYGRVPKVTPKVKWEVTSTTQEMNGDVPVSLRNWWATLTTHHIRSLMLIFS